MRIRNLDCLTSHGNKEGRRHIAQIMEAGLQAADPYYNTLRMLRLEGNTLYIGHPDFVPAGSPRTGVDRYELGRDIDRVFVFGAGKGIQRVVAAIEEVLGEHITGGHVLLKHCDVHSLERVGVSFGGHPVPDEDCVKGSRELLRCIQACNLTQRDLVFTVIGNGASSLMTLPLDHIQLEDVREVTRILQIEKGLTTPQVNLVRNQLDQLKGGRITRLLHPARMVHIIPIDLDEPNYFGQSGYGALMQSNFWLHTLPDRSTPEEAIQLLHAQGVWEQMSPTIRHQLENTTPQQDVLHADEFEGMDCRIFGIMPTKHNFIPVTMEKARELGYEPHFLMRRTFVEAAPAGALISRIAINAASEEMPFKPPCAFILTGELVVTVNKSRGIGGRNQEFALSAATVIQGNKRIVVAAADTDGTDGPGGRFNQEAWAQGCSNLTGGIVDGYTMAEAAARGIDVEQALRDHDTSDALWSLGSGIWATPNISVQDLIVVLVLGHDGEQEGNDDAD